jgi:hypothetical protein
VLVRFRPGAPRALLRSFGWQATVGLGDGARGNEISDSIFKELDRHCERSEAIQSYKERMDCFAALAMTGL